MKKSILTLFITLILSLSFAGCSTPEEKAEKYYEKGMSLLEASPDKAKLEFQNALQLKKNMAKAIYGLGLIAERQGDWKSAFALYKNVVEQQPNNVDALVKVGQIFLAGNKLDYALERSNKALGLDKSNIPALNLRAAIQIKLNDSKGALDYANQVLKLDPKNQDAYVVLATERIQAKDEQKAIEYLNKALAINEKNLALQLIKIRLLENSKVEEAEANYKKVIKLFPNTSFVRKNYAQFLDRYQRKSEAEAQLREISKAAPTDFKAKVDVVRYVIATKGVAAGQSELEAYVKNEPENYELAFALVNLYQAQKNTALEDKQLNQISQKAGDTTYGFKARSIMALKLIRANKKDEARKLIDAVLAIDKRNELALTLRAKLELEAKNYDSAIVDLRTVLRDSPDSSDAALMLAIAHENSGSPELAEEHFIKAFQTSNFSSTYGIPYSQFLQRRKQPERAEKVLEDVLAYSPNNATALRMLAQAKIARGDSAGAQALVDKIKLSGDKSAVADEIAGAISLSKNDFEGTLSAFKRAYEASPNKVEPLVAVVRTYISAGKNKEAIQFLQSVLKSNPNNLEANLMLGQLYSGMGDVTKAYAIFNEVTKKMPTNPVGFQQLANAQLRAADYAEAEKTVNQGLLVAPADFMLRLSKASIYEASTRIEDAIKVYEVLIKERPDSEVVANNLASLLTDHRSDKASYDRAYEVTKVFSHSQIPQFLDTYGWASYKVGKLDEAETALKNAAEKLPEMAVFHYHLAKVLIAKKDNSQAKQEMQKAIKYATTQPFEQKDDAIAVLKTL